MDVILKSTGILPRILSLNKKRICPNRVTNNTKQVNPTTNTTAVTNKPNY